MEDEDEIQRMTTVSVSQRKGGCSIHQTAMTTHIQTTYPTDDQLHTKKLTELIKEAQRKIDNGYAVAAQVSAIEAVVAQVKQIDAAMVREKNRGEKLEQELAELKRELERRSIMQTVAGALLPDGIKNKLRCARDLLNAFLGD